jgi:mono/diheme cytochrome c family protein
MRFGRINIILLLAFASSLLANWLIQPDYSRPNIEFAPNMALPIPYDAYAANANFTDGITLREPVEGTIIHGQMPLQYGPDTLEALRAGEELSNPYTYDDTVIMTDGKLLYDTFCQTCHGVSGLGDGPVSLRGYPPPPSLRGGRALQMKDGRLFHIMTYGQGNMPSYSAQISREDRWKIVLHLRSLQR